MDFLDPKLERRNKTILLLGYCLVALAIGIATLVLLYLSYGYGLNDNGKVTQNGLLFVSSNPTGSTIRLNGKPYKATTNTRVVITAGTYNLQVGQTGYRDWQRQVVVNGGDVQHFDYPFLFPTQLKPKVVSDVAADPSVALQSPDKRWLLLGNAADSGKFTEYDTKNTPTKPTPIAIDLPDASFTPGDGAQGWSLAEWASDNRHVLLQHTYVVGGVSAQEYILLDRDTPVSSVNLTKTLNLSTADTLALYNSKVDQVYVYDPTAKTLQRLNAGDGSEVSKLDHILSFKSYGSDKLLYVTDQAPAGKDLAGRMLAVLQDGQRAVGLRTLPAGATYSLATAQYGGVWYMAVGASTDPAVYVYRNPQSQVILPKADYPAAWRRLPLANPGFLAFSATSQYLAAEGGQNFAVYDFENKEQYHYTALEPLDQPQAHASWMDGNRLDYVSSGKLVVFDYDHQNVQSLSAANPAFLPWFSSDYHFVYLLRAGDSANTKPALTVTPLTTTGG